MDDRSTLHKGIEPDDAATNTSGKEFGTTPAVLARTTVTGISRFAHLRSHADDRTIKWVNRLRKEFWERDDVKW